VRVIAQQAGAERKAQVFVQQIGVSVRAVGAWSTLKPDAVNRDQADRAIRGHHFTHAVPPLVPPYGHLAREAS
jgi:hypothetical protein